MERMTGVWLVSVGLGSSSLSRWRKQAARKWDNWIVASTLGSAMTDYLPLYESAFEQFHTFALWHIRRFEQPTPEDALVVARALRQEGNMAARRLAEKIEQACRAAD
jgi:hypothetical protein